MFSDFVSTFVAPALLLSSLVLGAANIDKTKVGPLTPLSAKSKICNVLDYGGKADNKTDIGPAISAAFTQCVGAGGATLWVPPGSYLMATPVKLNKASAYAFQLDGLITLTSNGAFAGNAFIIQNTQDVEVFSSNGKGAIDGQGWITRLTKSGQNARLFRFITVDHMSIHDIIFNDSPTFHLIFNGVSNMEAYHITVHGPNIGGTDGIDVICTDNCWIHDCEVTNRDECVCVKSPSNNVLIEDIVCNQSGGMSIGSLDGGAVAAGGAAAAVSNITMRNILVYQNTQMLMIKTYPGGAGAVGYVKDSLFENFWAYDTTYALDIDQYWQSKTTPNTGAVALSGLTFRNWTGTVNNGVQRAPIVIRGSDIVPITDVTLAGFNMWTVNGNRIENKCNNVYGSGYCARSSTLGQKLTTFTTTQTTTVAPSTFTSPTKPRWANQGYGVTVPIPVYTPAALWAVGAASVASVATTTVKAASAITSSSSSTTHAVVTSTKPATTSSKATTLSTITVTSSTRTSAAVVTSTKSVSSTTTTKAAVTTTNPVSSSTTTKAVVTSATPVSGSLSKWSQCGGLGFTTTGTCAAGLSCVAQNAYYSQCL